LFSDFADRTEFSDETWIIAELLYALHILFIQAEKKGSADDANQVTEKFIEQLKSSSVF